MNNIRALVLAGGSGTRMQSERPKQFLDYKGKPLFLSTVQCFLSCGIPVTLVCRFEDLKEVEQIVKQELKVEAGAGSAGSSLPVQLVPGGKERFESSFAGLTALKKAGGCRYVLIQDAARPFLDKALVERVVETVKTYDTAVAAVPSKDTVKIADAEGFVSSTPDRASVYIIQTPQAFRLDLILDAYEKMFEAGDFTGITDDASVVERFTSHPVKLCMGDYENYKITTPEDLRYLD